MTNRRRSPVVVRLVVELLDLGSVDILQSTSGDYTYVLVLRALGEARQSQPFDIGSTDQDDGAVSLEPRAVKKIVELRGQFAFHAVFDSSWEPKRLRKLLATECLRIELLRVPLSDVAARRRPDLGAERVAAYQFCPWPWLLPTGARGTDGGSNHVRGKLCSEAAGRRRARPVSFLNATRSPAASDAAPQDGASGGYDCSARANADDGPWLRVHLRSRISVGCGSGERHTPPSVVRDEASAALLQHLLPGSGDDLQVPRSGSASQLPAPHSPRPSGFVLNQSFENFS